MEGYGTRKGSYFGATVTSYTLAESSFSMLGVTIPVLQRSKLRLREVFKLSSIMELLSGGTRI